MNDTVPVAVSADEASKLARRQKALEAIFGPRFVQSFQSPYMVIEDHVIRCPVGIRFFKKDFSYLSKQLYLEYQYRGWRGFDAQLLERYATVTTGKLAGIDTLLQNNINRLLKLLEQQGHESDLGLWPVVFTADVPIIATQARAYLGVLSRMDRLYALSGTANLLGVIDSSQRAVVEMSAKRAVRAFRSVLQTEVVRLYREAERVMAEQHRSGKVDARMAAVVQQQGEEIAAFAASTQAEAQEDGDAAADAGAVGSTEVEEAAGTEPGAAPQETTVAISVRRTRRAERAIDAVQPVQAAAAVADSAVASDA
ncbi:MAG TPA: hypothetical protein VHL79_01100 [Ramlibacter sp.]|nr:hypothetical protein [Ramlibacter sp.]